MEQVSIDENKTRPHNETIEICMNDTIMETMFEKNIIVQIESLTVEIEGSINEKKESE
jgi:D-arabinose 5-phosphate isomerase GutQ